MSEHEHKWMVVSTPTEYICECGVSAFDDGRGISPVPPQQTPQNIDWEINVRSQVALIRENAVGVSNGTQIDFSKALENGMVNIVRHKKKEWQEEERSRVREMVERTKDNATYSQDGLAIESQRGWNAALEAVITLLSQGETKEEKL